eukprot:jgi/Botrbrau1/2066/Bobra.0047s0031.1
MTAPPSTRSLGGLNLTFTKLSKVIAGILVLGYVAQFLAPSSRQYLALVPGRFIPCVWNIFTGGLLEINLWRLIFSVVSILLLARIIEPVWGSREFLKFICVVNVMAGAAFLLFLYIIYVLNPYAEKAGQILYGEFCGFHGVIAACLVALKQILPDNEVTLLALIKFRAKHLPSIYVISIILASIVLGGSLNNIPMVLLSTYFAWVYLRFLQTKPELALRGDPSSEFRFATFFPEPAQPLVDDLVSKFVRVIPLGGDFIAQPGQPVSGTTLTTPDNIDATRRRERGARALEERLSMKKAAAANRNSGVVADVEAAHQSESES